MDDLQLPEQLQTLWDQAMEIWLGGGWAMIAIAVIAMVMFSVGMNVWLQLRATKFSSVPEQTWRRWIDHPIERTGRIGKLIGRTSGDGSGSIKDMSEAFEQVRMTETAPFDRDLKVMKVCVSAAPLVGLLGTVTGMLATFSALATGGGGDKTMAMVAEGISEALITTETGLVIALPGLFFQYQLTRKFETYKAFLAHLESVCCQKLYRKQRAEQKRVAHAVASKTVARMLHERMNREPVAVASNE
jgi:biopolymer transport protein ExbB